MDPYSIEYIRPPWTNLVRHCLYAHATTVYAKSLLGMLLWLVYTTRELKSKQTFHRIWCFHGWRMQIALVPEHFQSYGPIINEVLPNIYVQWRKQNTYTVPVIRSPTSHSFKRVLPKFLVCFQLNNKCKRIILTISYNIILTPLYHITTMISFFNFIYPFVSLFNYIRFLLFYVWFSHTSHKKLAPAILINNHIFFHVGWSDISGAAEAPTSS